MARGVLASISPELSEALGGHAEELESFLARSAVRGEHTIARVRVALAVGVGIPATIEGWHHLVAGTPLAWVREGTYLVALVFSLVTLAWIRRVDAGASRSVPSWLTVSAVADPCFVAGVLVPAVVMNDGNVPFEGLLRDYGIAGLFLTSIGAGVRLRPTATFAGFLANIAVYAFLLVFDFHLAPVAPRYGVAYVLPASAVFLASCLLGVEISRRTRRLVFEGATATLVAERARSRLRSYLPEGVAEEAMRQSTISLGGAQIEVAVLFSDLRGFTSYAERTAPAALVMELNAYFEAMLDAIAAEGGVVDKYIGDALMIVFGAPKPAPDAAARAIRAAHAMVERLRVHNEERAQLGLPPFVQGIGIHFGPAVAGNVGTPENLQYTVMGDVVNVASRLEAATKAHRTRVFISAAAVESARATGGELPPLRHYGNLQVPGRAEQVDVFTLDSPELASSLAPPDLASEPAVV